MREKALRWAVNQDIVKNIAERGAKQFPAVTDRYVAGESREDATDYVAELNDDNITGLVDLLGEHVEERSEAAAVYDEYQELMHDIAAEDLDAELSVKLTHLGLDIDETLCQQYMQGLTERSKANDCRLWIDMESAAYTDETLDMYQDLQDEYGNVGICVQSYLERTENDLQRLDDDSIVRLVKGAYDTDADFDDWEAVGENYAQLLEQLFDSDKYVAVATHDEDLLDYAEDLAEQEGKPVDAFEFQFLKGVSPERERELVAEGYNVAEYVPYGDDAFDYFWRRVQEHPANLKHGVNAIIDTLRS